MTEKQLREFHDSDPYTAMKENQWNENMYELPSMNKEDKRLQKSHLSTAASNKASWSKPQLCMTVLLCLILILLIIILGIVTVVYATGNNVECTNTATGAGSSSNTNEWETTRDSAQNLINIVNTLSNLQDTSTSTAGVVDDILLIAQELLVLHNDSTALPTSCKEIKERQPLSPSGVYLLASATGGATYTMYCNMGTLCGSGGGWTRLAYLDMSDATQNCPSGFRLYQSGGVRACGRLVTNNGSCVSVQFPSNGISYSQICGRVFGHSYYTPDAVNTEFGSNHSNINGDYVDGVSITRGSPRQYVWTLMAGGDNFGFGGRYNCPCVNGSIQVPQPFVGSHYFCEGGNDLLWDGKGCSSDETLCCSAPGLPWFHRDYGNTTTTDYIELRVCADQETTDEDVPVSFYEIYIK